MAGTAISRRNSAAPNSDFEALKAEHNKTIDDLEVVRNYAGIGIFNYKVENLAAGADLTARAFFKAPVALTILDSVNVIPEAASTGIDGSNTLVLTLRNITESVDIATTTRTIDLAANAPVSLTLAAANADITSGDVLGLVVTQGAAADAGTFLFQFSFQRQAIDAATDLLAAKITDA